MASTDSSTSYSRTVTSGVIQDAVVGLLLFLVYANGALNSIFHGFAFMFAEENVVSSPRLENFELIRLLWMVGVPPG